MSNDTFSRRHGLAVAAKEVTVRDDAPESLRSVVLETARELDWGPSVLRTVICRVLRVRPDQSNWSEYPNIWDEVQYLMYSAPWFKVYDIIEKLYQEMVSEDPRMRRNGAAPRFAAELNAYFVEEGIGWKLEDGLIVTRGAEVFESVLRGASDLLDQSGRNTAARHLHEAIGDLSRRPEPDASGAIYHAMGALECVARDLTGDEKATLGAILKTHPALVPPPLDKALGQIWGFASEQARHVLEGRNPTRDEAELVVGLAATICTYLVRKGA